MTDRLALAISALVEAIRAEVRAEMTPASGPDRLHDIDSAAAALSLGRSLVYSEIAAGRLKSIKIGRRRLIAAGEIAAYIARAAEA